MEGSSRSGYEYRYRVSMGDERKEEGFPKAPCRTYFLEVRTNFILKPITPTGAGEILIDTERFGDRLRLAELYTPETIGPVAFRILSGKNMVDINIRSRLSKYCMPDAQIQALAQTAFDFVHDPQYESLRTVPVLLSIDVYTVQLEGEPLDVTMDRSVKPDFLIPLELRWFKNRPLTGARANLLSYLDSLPVVRVREDDDMEFCPICLVEPTFSFETPYISDKYASHEKHSVELKEGLGLMEACPICLREPIVGAKIASLPCKHAFHDHCICRWLLKCQSCPVCRDEIVFKKDYSKRRRIIASVSSNELNLWA